MNPWPAWRTALRALVADLIDLDVEQVRFSTDGQPHAGTQVVLTTVSDVAAEPHSDRTAAQETLTTDHRIQLQVRIETSEGEGELEDDAHALATSLRMRAQRANVAETLAAAGLVLVREPSEIVDVSYPDTETDEWIHARAFELPLRGQHVDTVSEGADEILSVEVSGEIADGGDFTITVTEPDP